MVRSSSMVVTSGLNNIIRGITKRVKERTGEGVGRGPD